MDFSNKVVIITGAGSGIGRGAAEYLSGLNAIVVLVGRNEENLKETASKCASETLIIVSDVTKQDDRVKIIKETVDKYGKINVLVNNAGHGKGGEVATMAMEDYDSVMDLNVRSVFHLTQLAIPYLIKSQGNVVNVSSVAAERPFPAFSAYCMSKAALDQFTRCLALELAPKNVRVNSINPAVIVSNFLKAAGFVKEDKEYEEFLERETKNHALGRVGQAIETAHAIAYLASDLSTFITGSCLAVDGGRLLMGPQ